MLRRKMFDERTRRKRRKLFGEVGEGGEEQRRKRRKNYDIRTEFPLVDSTLSVEGI